MLFFGRGGGTVFKEHSILDLICRVHDWRSSQVTEQTEACFFFVFCFILDFYLVAVPQTCESWILASVFRFLLAGVHISLPVLEEYLLVALL